MKQSNQIARSAILAIILGCMAACNTIQHNDLDWRIHPLASLLGSITPAIVVAFAYYWVSGWLAKRKDAESENEPASRGKVSSLLPWFVLVIAVGGMLLWFNHYTFSSIQLGDGVSIPVRMSRFTGESEMLVLGKWVPVNPSDSSARQNSFDLQTDDLGKIQGQARISQQFDLNGHPIPAFSATVYNGTSHQLTAIVVELVVSNSPTQEGADRQYNLEPASGYPLPPLTSSDFSARIDFSPPAGTWSWQILRASALK